MTFHPVVESVGATPLGQYIPVGQVIVYALPSSIRRVTYSPSVMLEVNVVFAANVVGKSLSDVTSVNVVPLALMLIAGSAPPPPPIKWEADIA